MSGIKNLLILALAGASLLPALASAADAPAATFTAEQEARIGKIAADYLVAHPEVLLQASQKLQQIPVSYTHLTLPTTCNLCRSRWSPYH